jgi:hypothetical protein
MPPSRFKFGRRAAAPPVSAGASCKRAHNRWRRQSTVRRGVVLLNTALPVLPLVIPGHRDCWPLAWLALPLEERHPVSPRPLDPLPACRIRRPGVRDPEPSTCPVRVWTEQPLWLGSRHLPPPCRLCRRHRSQCPEPAADPPSPPLRMSWYGYETVGAQKGSQPHRICRCHGFALIAGVKLLRSLFYSSSNSQEYCGALLLLKLGADQLHPASYAFPERRERAPASIGLLVIGCVPQFAASRRRRWRRHAEPGC